MARHKKAPGTCPGASSEFASPATAHELCLNPLRRQGSQACLRQYHIRSPRHNNRPFLTSPATKTQPRWVSARRVTLVGTFPHAPRLEPYVRLSSHTAQHSQIRLGLSSVAWCAYRLKVIHPISLREILEPCARYNVIYFYFAGMERFSFAFANVRHVECTDCSLEENDFFSQVVCFLPVFISVLDLV